jgi:hypothetical protein
MNHAGRRSCICAAVGERSLHGFRGGQRERTPTGMCADDARRLLVQGRAAVAFRPEVSPECSGRGGVEGQVRDSRGRDARGVDEGQAGPIRKLALAADPQGNRWSSLCRTESSVGGVRSEVVQARSSGAVGGASSEEKSAIALVIEALRLACHRSGHPPRANSPSVIGHHD